MNSWFDRGRIKDQLSDRARNVARILAEMDADIVAICEGANSHAEHRRFLDEHLPNMGYRVALGKSRGAQNLVYYYRDSVEMKDVDDGHGYYADRVMDIEGDRVKEIAHFERRPLEATVVLPEAEFMMILVHAKSKGVYDVADLPYYQMIASANRRRLIMQAIRLRGRLDELLDKRPQLPVVVLGDMNDGPGFDAYEKQLGRSFVETVMGSVFDPTSIFANALAWLREVNPQDLWTAEFVDPIVSHREGWKHRVWIDHILLSPHFRKPEASLGLVKHSGKVFQPARRIRPSSDHMPVFCDMEF
jgi:endonuclease/exonuclease/phosphatase family metal-dependent hydrolase